MTNEQWPAEESGFHIEEEDRFDWNDFVLEDYLSLVVFWVLALVVFMQFFSRYVLGDSIAWTEEMARYFLVAVAFLGGSMAVRKRSHISVEFFYRYMPSLMQRLLSTLVDFITIAFFAAGCWITWKLADITTAMMVSVDIPKSFLYYVVLIGFVLMLLRSIQIMISRWRLGSREPFDTP
ncbi:TRAP transporter small permease [Halomonas sp.]|jgi:TRAP-type C4-dicarboxylate transport system permease small subunit|uniref:TRAP transporter small permease n=1 Tax=Halomonas sp. TaxID=1486246 RepID=UPI003565AC95